MFDNIAPRYDFLNHFLSVGIDRLWRRKAISLLKKDSPQIILDVATGTGDFAIETARQLKAEKIYGIDISAGMIEIGRKKIRKLNLSNIVELSKGDSEDIKFDSYSVDAVTVAFGVRNFENLEKGLSEIFRVLKKGGKVVILEFSKPKRFPIRNVYKFYFKRILPFCGKIISKDNSAYTYLPNSVNNFPDGISFIEILEKCGFVETQIKPLTAGISTIYTGYKR